MGFEDLDLAGDREAAIGCPGAMRNEGRGGGGDARTASAVDTTELHRRLGACSLILSVPAKG
jgi:hypothetical protein